MQHERLHVIEKVYEQQKYMYDNHTHTVNDRIVSISQPYIRPKKNSKSDRKTEIKDNRDRIEVERGFSLAKRNYGLGLIKTKLDTTTRSTIALSIIAMNVAKLSWDFLHIFSEWVFWGIRQCMLPLSDKNSKLIAESVTC